MPLTARLLLTTVLAVVVLACVDMPQESGASFTTGTVNPASGVQAASDWTPPTVSVRDPGAVVSGTTAVTVDAADGETGVGSVTVQYVATGGSAWSTLCTDAVAPYACSWDTTKMTNDSYDLRAVATDGAGYSTVSDVVRTRISQDLTVLMDSPGEVVRGTVPLSARVLNPGALTLTVTIQYATSGGTWKTLCTDAIAPYSCPWDTTSVANDFHDLRAFAVSGLNTYYSDTVTDVLVDNAAPSVTMTDPGSPLSGAVTFAATATDVSSGVANVTLQYAVAGSSSFTTMCTVTAPPYTCRYDTTKIATTGLYDFRATATDLAGISTVSAVVRNRQIDNTVSSVSMEDPGAYLTGTVTVAASANSTAGVTSVRIQRATNGGATWTDVCTDTTAPYSCSWDTTTVIDGAYDLRAVLLDGSGRTTTSSVVSGRRVDNSPLRGVDVQAVNGGLTTGRIEAGDTVTFTYSSQVNPATLLTGWNGSAQAMFVRLRDGARLGLGTTDDTLDFWGNSQLTTAVNLGSVNLKQDAARTNKTQTFNATMTASTETVNGVIRTVVTVRLGAGIGGSVVRTVATAGAMIWTPSSSARSMTGVSSSVAPATESGTADKDF